MKPHEIVYYKDEWVNGLPSISFEEFEKSETEFKKYVNLLLENFPCENVSYDTAGARKGDYWAEFKINNATTALCMIGWSFSIVSESEAVIDEIYEKLVTLVPCKEPIST